MEKLIRVEALFLALGFGTNIARGQATRVIKKVMKLEDGANQVHVVSQEDAKKLLTEVAFSKSKNSLVARQLIENDGFLELDIFTEDANFKPVKEKAPKKGRVLKSDLEEFLKSEGLEEQFKQWLLTK